MKFFETFKVRNSLGTQKARGCNVKSELSILQEKGSQASPRVDMDATETQTDKEEHPQEKQSGNCEDPKRPV